jgi:curved DNA-binding protein CbpA
MTTDNSSTTHYDVLEVPANSTFETIKASYQTKARKLHPDKNHGVESEEFLRLQAAWECLRTVENRKEYDASLKQQETQFSKSQPVPLDEWELVEEEESGDLCFVYACRCGEDLWLPQAALMAKEIGEKIHVTCDGCSLVFHVVRPNDA